MAKKAVGKVRGDKKQGMAKVIVPIKSPQTGAYGWQAKILAVEEAEKFLEKHS